jgi:transcriptional regulator with XRE-family HTH domain
MNQPDLGITIAELRTQKGLTQEKLAEYCEVSKRTIQRIESGEVEPRAFTLNNLSNILEFDFSAESTNNEAMWLTALHLSCIFANIFIPLLIWSRKKKHSYKINQHGRQVLNFQITITLMLFAAFLLVLVFLGGVIILDESGRGGTDLFYTGTTFLVTFPFLLIGMFSIYQGAVNAGRALADKPIRYRMSIPLVK